MIAEEYIKHRGQDNKRFFGTEMLNVGEAYEAIDIARREEREKMKTLFFEKVQDYCQVARCDMPIEISRIYTDMYIELSKTK